MQKSIRIIAYGDSLTYGFPYGHPLSWVAITEEKTGIPLLNHGSNGSTLKDLVRRVMEDVIDLKPNYCIVMGGTNDIFTNHRYEFMKENFEALIKKLQQNKINPIIGLPPPVLDKKREKELTKFRNWLKKQARAQKLPYIDFFSALLNPKTKTPNRKFFEDFAHPNSEGYQAMAEVSSKVLCNLLGIKSLSQS
ncbi:MAG: hypothetical protein HYU97_00810 [Deltaproteobacteria bacterium]|nr:hypothetical protein [Deltaproteobacteria bacterium]